LPYKEFKKRGLISGRKGKGVKVICQFENQGFLGWGKWVKKQM